MACFMTDLPELDEHVRESSGLLKSEAVWTFRKLPAILSDWNPATIEKQFKVNALAPLLVTQCLLPSMAANSKVVMITSRMGSMADNGSGGYYGYRMSKAALNAAGVSMAKDLASQGIAVALLHPGFVQTEMVNYGGDIDATTSALRLQQLIDDLNLANSGQFWHSNGESLPW